MVDMNWKYIKSISKNNRQWIILRNVCSLLANKLAAQIVRDEIIITKLHPLLFQAPLSQMVLKICMIPLLSTEQSLFTTSLFRSFIFNLLCLYILTSLLAQLTALIHTGYKIVWRKPTWTTSLHQEQKLIMFDG